MSLMELLRFVCCLFVRLDVSDQPRAAVVPARRDLSG